jgi:predicted DNA-binding protein YlxM (UPF0122 family)
MQDIQLNIKILQTKLENIEERLLLLEKYMIKDSKRSDLPSPQEVAFVPKAPTILKFSKAERFDG